LTYYHLTFRIYRSRGFETLALEGKEGRSYRIMYAVRCTSMPPTSGTVDKHGARIFAAHLPASSYMPSLTLRQRRPQEGRSTRRALCAPACASKPFRRDISLSDRDFCIGLTNSSSYLRFTHLGTLGGGYRRHAASRAVNAFICSTFNSGAAAHCAYNSALDWFGYYAGERDGAATYYRLCRPRHCAKNSRAGIQTDVETRAGWEDALSRFCTLTQTLNSTVNAVIPPTNYGWMYAWTRVRWFYLHWHSTSLHITFQHQTQAVNDIHNAPRRRHQHSAGRPLTGL